MQLEQIKTDTKEGQMLIAALAMLSTQVTTLRSKTPDEVIEVVERLQKEIYDDGRYIEE